MSKINKGISGPIRTVEQVECPSCDARLGVMDYQRVLDDHPTKHTERQTIKTDCSHCGSRYTGVYYLEGGIWCLESINPSRMAPQRKSA